MTVDGPTLGWQVIDWIETYLVHGPGDVQGQPIVLDDEFARFVLAAYEVYPRSHPRAGRRVRNRAFLSRPKGRAKSELAAMLACAEGLGPVRFDGWDAHGEPVGRPVDAPEILCFATEEDQAGNTYGNVAFMLTEGAAYDAYPGVDIGRKAQTSTRVLLPNHGVIEPMTSGDVSKDGGKSTFVVWDEVHLWFEPRLVRLYHTVRRNLGKRRAADPWGLATSTMYRPGQGSVAEAMHADHLRKPDGTMLWDHREGPAEPVTLDELYELIGDDDRLRAALADAYGAFAPHMDFDRLIDEEFRSESVRLEDSIRYFLNRKIDHSEDFLPVDIFDATADPGRKVKQGAKITLGFDGSDRGRRGRKADSTVLRGCDLATGHLFTVGIWEHPEDVDEWEVPRAEVMAAFREAFSTWSVVTLYADPPGWTSELAELAEDYGSDRIVEWYTSRNVPMASALDLLVTELTKRSITHDGDPAARAHYAHAKKWIKPAPKDDPDRRKELVLVRKPIYDGPLKIDTVVADALALKARADAIASGARRRGAKVVGFR